MCRKKSLYILFLLKKEKGYRPKRKKLIMVYVFANAKTIEIILGK